MIPPCTLEQVSNDENLGGDRLYRKGRVMGPAGQDDWLKSVKNELGE
jgi:hypothetical protein